MPAESAAQIRLREFADENVAQFLQRYFKTGPGEYGEGDRFLGIRAPILHKVAAEFEGLTLDELDVLLQSPIHEDRLLALLILGRQYSRGNAKLRPRIYRLYLRRLKFVNNWDLVDSSAPYLVGPHLADGNPAPLYRLAKSRRVWDRRVAVLATLHFIRNDRFDVTLELARLLHQDTHDLIHKAVGWMLREVGKRNVGALCDFLDGQARFMPRTALRYAIERLPEPQRRRYLAISRQAS